MLDLVKWKIYNNSTELTSIQNQIKNKQKKNLKWTRDISDLVILIYGFSETNSFNNGEIDIKEISNFIGEVFGVEIKDCSNIFRQIRKRKIKERTDFLDEMKLKITQRMDNADNGIYACRKERKKK